MKGKRNVWAVFLGIAVVAMSAAGCSTGGEQRPGTGESECGEETYGVYFSQAGGLCADYKGV